MMFLLVFDVKQLLFTLSLVCILFSFKIELSNSWHSFLQEIVKIL